MKKPIISIALAAMVASAIGLDARQATSPAVPPKPPSVATFLMDAAADNDLEIDLAKMAEHRATNADVKSLARTIDRDHRGVAIELESLARAKKVTLSTLVPVATAEVEDRFHELNDGIAFDRAYVHEVVINHQKDIAEFQSESMTTDTEVKDLIARMLPAMRAHLTQAETLQTQLAKQPRRDRRERCLPVVTAPPRRPTASRLTTTRQHRGRTFASTIVNALAPRHSSAPSE